MNLEMEIGIVLAVVGLALGAWHWLRRQGMTQTRGSIVRSEGQSDGGGPAKVVAKQVKLTIRFNDAQGLVRFFTGYARGADRKSGEQINVLYLPNDPSRAMIDDASIWVAPIVVTVVGLGLAVMGFLKLG